MLTIRDLLDNVTEDDLDKPLYVWDKTFGTRFAVTDLDPTMDDIFELNIDSED
jgi:hypothetical protein